MTAPSIDRDEGQRALVRAAFAYLVGGAGEAAGPEGLGVDVFDFKVVRRLFRQVCDVGNVHGLSKVRCEDGSPQGAALAGQRLFKRGRPFVVG